MSDFDKMVNEVAAMCLEDALDVMQMYDEDDADNGVAPLPKEDRIRYLLDLADNTFIQFRTMFGDEVRAKLEQLCNDHYKQENE
jgi:hypothetical protein